VVTAFWHIPWPRPRVLATCPWAGRLLDGLLGSNIVGFQTEEDRVNFLRSAESTLDVNVDNRLGTISHRGRTTHLRVYPVGVEWASPVVRATPAATACRAQVCRDLNLPTDIRLGVGIDRLDYTKGLNHKLLAVERLLEVQPDLRGKFVFVQIAEPSRGSLPAYQAARRQLLETRDRVNHRFGSDAVAPILLLENHYEAADVYRFYRAADLCYVGSLDDGMNLVAKEFVSARDDERGVLILSEFAGAARQLSAALLINPYHVDRSARALAQALTMSNAEQRRRMRILRANVQACSATWWAQQLLGDAAAAVSSSSGVAAADRPFAEQALV
jgi:trehalose 6-phosphate synthase